MKKLLLIISAFGIFSAGAQDLAVAVVAPTSGQNIYKGEPFNISVQVTNTTATPITSTDTFVYALAINNTFITNSQGGITLYLLPPSNLSQGQTATGSVNNLSLNFSQDINNASMCAWLRQVKNGMLQQDGDSTNNYGCQTVYFKLAHPSGFGEIPGMNSVKVYPNPAKDVIHFDLGNTDIASAEIFSISGKLVEKISLTNTSSLNVGSYFNGIYFYQLRNASGELKSSGKFTVSK
jgi:hypothetical protein